MQINLKWVLISSWDLQFKTNKTNELTVFGLNFWGVASKSEGLFQSYLQICRIW